MPIFSFNMSAIPMTLVSVHVGGNKRCFILMETMVRVQLPMSEELLNFMQICSKVLNFILESFCIMHIDGFHGISSTGGNHLGGGTLKDDVEPFRWLFDSLSGNCHKKAKQCGTHQRSAQFEMSHIQTT